MIPRNTGLIIALDVTDRETALRVTQSVAGSVDAIKVNFPLILGTDLSIIDRLAKFAPIICDFKIADIPNTNSMIVGHVLDHSASGIIVHGFVGGDSVRACVERAEGKLDVFVVTEMSHPGALDFLASFGERLARLAVECGASGVVAPATRPERVRAIREAVGNLKIICPGVGAQGGSAAEAFKAGADYVIVGRQIYTAKDPGAEADKLVEEISRSMT